MDVQRAALAARAVYLPSQVAMYDLFARTEYMLPFG